jgi:cyanophycin synthetase
MTASVDRLSRLGRAGRALGPEIDLLRSAGACAGAVRRVAAATAAWGPVVRCNVYRRIWEDAAQSVGAEMESTEGDFWTLVRGESRTTVFYQQVMLDNAVHLLLALDKSLVHDRLRQVGLPTTPYLEFRAGDPEPALEFLRESGAACVVKPADRTSGGEGVTCGIDTEDRFRRALVSARRWHQRVLVEKQAIGEEYRFLFLDGELLGVVHRRPPTVTGDGHSSVMDLIFAENRRRVESDGRHGMSPLLVDLDCIMALERAGKSLRSVVDADEVLALKSAVNSGGAADTETVVPENLSPELLAEVSAAVRAVGLRLASVEVVTPDPQLSLRDAGGIVLEVNGTPGLQYHYNVSDPSTVTRVALPILAALLGVDAPSGWQSGGVAPC